MKIIAVSNFDKESVSDILIAESVSEYYVRYIVEFLNSRFSGMSSPNYYRAVPDDHKLYKFEL